MLTHSKEKFDDTLDMLLENNEIKLKGEYVVLVNIDKSEEAVDKKRKRENGADEIEQVEIDVINHVKGIYFIYSSLLDCLL